jgi:hypothetical protein
MSPKVALGPSAGTFQMARKHSGFRERTPDSENGRGLGLVARGWVEPEWHQVKLQYTAVSMLCAPLSMVGIAASKLGPARDGVGLDAFRSSCQKAARATDPSNYG